MGVKRALSGLEEKGHGDLTWACNGEFELA